MPGLIPRLLPLCAVLLSGCASRTIEPAVADLPAGAAPKLDWSDWGLALDRAVAADRVDYPRLLADCRPLDRFLAMASRVGPQSTPDQFPTDDDRRAYLINCYNATILRSVLQLARRGKPPADLPLDFEAHFRFRVDGRLRTPADLRHELEALAAGDWRIRFALSDADLSGPPLPQHVFLGDLLDAQLNQVTRSALQAPEVVRIDHSEKVLWLWQGLYEIRDNLVRDFEKRTGARDADILNVLLEWSDRLRREELNSAVGYEIAALPDSNQLNSVEPPPPGQQGLFSSLKSISFLRPH